MLLQRLRCKVIQLVRCRAHGWLSNIMFKRAEKPLTRVQQEALSVSDRLTLLAHVMDGSALLIVPAPATETDSWVEPSAWSKYYSEAQFAPIRVQLQTVVTGYVNGDPFNFSRAANQLRENMRALSPSIYPRDQQLRLEYFYNQFEAFYRAIWCTELRS